MDKPLTDSDRAAVMWDSTTPKFVYLEERVIEAKRLLKQMMKEAFEMGMISSDQLDNISQDIDACFQIDDDNQEAAKGGCCDGNTQTNTSNPVAVRDKSPRKSLKVEKIGDEFGYYRGKE